MNLDKITNPTVKKAIEALQANDLEAWFSYFTNDAVFTDDGRTMDFKSFFENAFAKQEKFLSIDKIENGGKNLTGNFYAGQWGTFEVYLNFHLNENQQITRVDIGQTSKL